MKFPVVKATCYNAGMNAKRAPKSGLRWCQFRLRTLFVVTAIVAVQSAVCCLMLREWQRQQAAAAGLGVWDNLILSNDSTPIDASKF